MKVQSKGPAQPFRQVEENARPNGARNTVREGTRQPGSVGSGQAAGKVGYSGVDAFIGGPPAVQATFQKQFGALAADKEKFHDTLRNVFGAGYDVAQSEQYRQRALAGDFGWLPPVKWVASATLRGANGAYDAESGTVLLNRQLPPELAASTFVEEAGHHLDARLNAKDSPGDEGELFRRVLSGEKLSSGQVAELRAENDKGTIYVDGKAREVEFWNPFKAIGKAAKAVGNAIGSAAKAVGNVVKKAGERVGDGLHGLVTGGFSTVIGAARNIGEGLGTFMGGVGKLFKGQFGEGLKQMGLGLVKTLFQTPADALLMLGGRVISAVQTLVGVEPPGRKLRGDEIAALKQVYGDSIDYASVRIKEGDSGLFSKSGRAFAHGNTLYIPPDDLPLTLDLLVHEMAHVWQHQNGGTDYMSEALWAQEVGDGYDFEKGIAEGKSWSELNPEQQAELLQMAYRSGFFDGQGQRFTYGGKDYTDYLKAALAQLRAGKGAP